MRVIVLFCALLALAPQLARPAGAGQSVGGVDYQLGPGDRISVKVAGVTAFDITTRVSNSGRVHIPFIGVMFVAGKTAVELEGQIAEKIVEHQLVTAPAVRVQIDQFRAQPVYVIGDVTAPGQFILTGDMYLLDVISKAGGLLISAADTGYVYRRSALQPDVQAKVGVPSAPGEAPAPAEDGALPAEDSTPAAEPKQEVVEVNFEELRLGMRPEANLLVRGGDVVYVPRRQQQNVFIVGDVITPGVYSLPRRGQVTATRALIYAGGPLPSAKTSAAFIMRHEEGGTRKVIPFDFHEILGGKEEDIAILPNDILFVPTSNVKAIGIGLLNLVPRLLQQYLIF